MNDDDESNSVLDFDWKSFLDVHTVRTHDWDEENESKKQAAGSFWDDDIEIVNGVRNN